MTKTVIIGGVAGGASCAARLRRLDESAEIVLLERGPYISYANCGLPYHVGGVIKKQEALLLQAPEVMRRRFNIDVRVGNEVIAIDRAKKTVTVRRTDSGPPIEAEAAAIFNLHPPEEIYEESYDKLVLATGSSPLRPPIPGVDSPLIRTLWTVPDAADIRALVQAENVSSAAVIGGGFIGLEMAENLRQAGLRVTLIEMLDQVMAPLDYEMAQLLHENIRRNGVDLRLGDGVASFARHDNRVHITLNSGEVVRAELVILAIGLRPNSQLAKEAGLSLSAKGGLVVDEFLRTSDPDIYAVGDVIEVEDYVFRDKTMIPLAGPANKQGRIAADNIVGGNEAYRGTQGTSVAKVFDLTAASVGANEKSLIKRGMVQGQDYESVIITQNSHAGYYPGAQQLTLKLLFSMDGKRIFGAQIVGQGGVDKRIDTIAVTQRLGGGVRELKELELAYAPPYSAAKDPVNMAGFVAENVLRGLTRFAPWDVVEREPDTLILDVRIYDEIAAYALPRFLNLPLENLRQRLDKMDKDRPIVVFCAAGVRAHTAARILTQHGFSDVRIYPGGVRFYRSTHS